MIALVSDSEVIVVCEELACTRCGINAGFKFLKAVAWGTLSDTVVLLKEDVIEKPGGGVCQ